MARPSEPEMIADIKSRGYWRILIRPSTFEERRIGTREDCLSMVENCRVSVSGWPFPHSWSQEGAISGEGYAGSVCIFDRHVEIWRMYQSGQFATLVAMREDRRSTIARNPDYGRPWLSWTGAIYAVTEVLEFATRLASNASVFPAGTITIELHGCKDRVVWDWPGREPLLREHVCRNQVVRHRLPVSGPDLLSRAEELTIAAATDIFEQFNWFDASRPVLAEHRRRFLNRDTD